MCLFDFLKQNHLIVHRNTNNILTLYYSNWKFSIQFLWLTAKYRIMMQHLLERSSQGQIYDLCVCIRERLLQKENVPHFLNRKLLAIFEWSRNLCLTEMCRTAVNAGIFHHNAVLVQNYCIILFCNVHNVHSVQTV